MDKELETYYENRFSMFGSQAWKDLMEDVEGMIEATDRIGGKSTVEDLFFAKGELSILYWLKSLEDVSKSTYEELNNASGS